MTDIAPAEAKAPEPVNSEDAKLEQFGYTQKLDRSVGRLASFAIGFATISATTAVFTGFGAGYFTAGAPFVWTLLLAAAVFVIWIAHRGRPDRQDPAGRLLVPVDQSHPRLDDGAVHRRDGPCRMDLRHDRCRLHPVRLPRQPVRLEHEPDRADPRRHRRDGRLHAHQPVRRAVRDDGQQHRREPRVRHHRRRNDSRRDRRLLLAEPTTNPSRCSSPAARPTAVPRMCWLGWPPRSDPSSGSIGVEASADVAEETVNARRVIPRTMFYALTASIVIEFLHVRRLRAGDQERRRPSGRVRRSHRGDHHPAGRPGHQQDRRRRRPDQRDGVHPGQHPGRHPADLLDGPRQHAAVLARLAARVPDRTARRPTPCSDSSASRRSCCYRH